MNRQLPPLTPAEEAEFIRLWNEGVTAAEIGARFGRARSTVWNIRLRLGLVKRREHYVGNVGRFDITEDQIYVEAAKLREKWHPSRTPLQACPSTSRRKKSG